MNIIMFVLKEIYRTNNYDVKGLIVVYGTKRLVSSSVTISLIFKIALLSELHYLLHNTLRNIFHFAEL